MFGYVKPIRCQLSEEDWNQYRAAYCGLCHVLGKRYGFPARFIVNFDFTFLSLLSFSLQTDQDVLQIKHCRCIASPFRKKCVCAAHSSLECAADASIVLFWWQLNDAILDQNFPKAIPYRALRLLFRSAYKKAHKRLPAFSKHVQNCLGELQQLEKSCVDSIDRPADTFARTLESLASVIDHDSNLQLKQLLYHLGRFIYILDAWDDVEEDHCAQRYNPVAKRFSLSTAEIPETVKNELEQTLCHSITEMNSAFAEIGCTKLKPLLNNILTSGLYTVIHQVSIGEKPKKEKRFHERSVSGAGRFPKRKR